MVQVGGNAHALQLQDGAGNDARSLQTVSVGTINQRQQGTHNRANADQHLAGPGSSIRQVQEGHANDAHATQFGSWGSSANQVQLGNGNDSSVASTAVRTAAPPPSSAGMTTVQVRQDLSLHSRARIEQQGSLNEASAEQRFTLGGSIDIEQQAPCTRSACISSTPPATG